MNTETRDGRRVRLRNQQSPGTHLEIPTTRLVNSKGDSPCRIISLNSNNKKLRWSRKQVPIFSCIEDLLTKSVGVTSTKTHLQLYYGIQSLPDSCTSLYRSLRVRRSLDMNSLQSPKRQPLRAPEPIPAAVSTSRHAIFNKSFES